MPVIKHGTEALKQRYLPRIATGEIVMSFGVTEPNAGTDTSRIQTRAEREGDRFIVHGRKVWNTNAQQATHMLLLARTAPRDAAQARSRGLTLFFTPFDRAQITVREIEKLGRAAVDSNEIFIDGLEVPAEDVVGEVGAASTTCSTRSIPSASSPPSRRWASAARRSSAPCSTPRSGWSSTGPSARTRPSRIPLAHGVGQAGDRRAACA